ncbi:lymphocyte cytosolic protein 2 [Xiphophorus couchianus]|uniref:lymphocyte cytosolic protein 2 n=1 Tax=Xiphophorus couchianus TaxID=32473 RepID=UPI0010167BEB|nr:lymphocyte cytosolic protein 2-like [Xiphophorus couchianus]
MSLTEGPIKDDVMAWEPKKLADYMRQLKLFGCDNVVLKRGITGAQFLHMIQCDLHVFPITYVPILAKVQRDLNRQERRKYFGSKSKKSNHLTEVRGEKVCDELDSESDYEEFNEDAGDGNYVVPLTNPLTADNLHKAKEREAHRLHPVFSLPEPQRVSKVPCLPTAHSSNFQLAANKKPEKAPVPQRAFSRLTEGSVALDAGSLSRRRPLPTVPQLRVSNRANNITPHVPVPISDVLSNQSIRTTGHVNKQHVQSLDPSWYKGKITREQAEVSLREVNKDGAFLVRDSSQGSAHPYTLMLLNQGKIFNIKIQRQNDFHFLGNGTNNSKSFLRVKEMIIHHMNTPLLLRDATDQCSQEQPQCCLLHPAGL